MLKDEDHHQRQPLNRIVDPWKSKNQDESNCSPNPLSNQKGKLKPKTKGKLLELNSQRNYHSRDYQQRPNQRRQVFL
jgi:hypothetical protein